MSSLNSLNFQDLCILRRFIEKAQRESLFTLDEQPTSDILHKKLCNIINEVIEKSKTATSEQTDPST
jgi:hypothetical protein